MKLRTAIILILVTGLCYQTPVYADESGKSPARAGNDLPILRAPEQATFPPVFDWRDVGGQSYITPRKYQGADDCWAFAAIGQLESHILIYDGRTENLSEQQLISCNLRGKTTDGGGNYPTAYEVMLSPGIVTRECFPFVDGENPDCIQSFCEIRGRISGYYKVASDIESIKYALQTYGPVASIVPSSQSAGHAVLVIGWDDSQQSWIIKNSQSAEFSYVSYDTSKLIESAHQIEYIPNSISNLYVTKPDGDEAWLVDSDHTIEWACVLDVHHFEVGYYSNSAYTPINTFVDGALRELSWTTPLTPISDLLIKVTAYDANNNVMDTETSIGASVVLDERFSWEAAGEIVRTSSYDMTVQGSIPNGTGGQILLWKEKDASGQSSLRVSNLDSGGSDLWAPGGITIRTAGSLNLAGIVTDGDGGAIVAWYERPVDHFRVLAQHIDSNGSPQWGSGKIVAMAPFLETASMIHANMTSDGAGGAIITWVWDDLQGNQDIYAERLDHNGNAMWGPPVTGVPVCTKSGDQYSPEIVAGENNDAIIIWRENNGKNASAQKIDSDGSPQWDINGVLVFAANSSIGGFQAVSDRYAGAIVAWTTGYSSTTDIYTQRISDDGTVLWYPDGVLVCAHESGHQAPDIVTDGFGGVIVVWADDRLTARETVYGQRIDADGSIRWDLDGLPILMPFWSISPYIDLQPQVTSDGNGGAIVTWLDTKEAYDVFTCHAQRVNADGDKLWHTTGEMVCGPDNTEMGIFLPDAHGSNIYVSWTNADNELRLQKLEGDYSAAPRCDVSALIIRSGTPYELDETTLFGCPNGDGGDVLEVTCDFNDDDMAGIASVPATDVTMDFTDLPFSSCSPAYYGIDGTPENGYTVKLIKVHFGGCTHCDGDGCIGGPRDAQEIPVIYGGKTAGFVEDLMAKTPDVNHSGKIDLSDQSFLGTTYNKSLGDPGYNSCCDFNNDDTVDSSDLSIFGSHYQHECPASASSPHLVKSEAALEFLVDQNTGSNNPDKVEVKVLVENASGVVSMGIGLDLNIADLRYSGWTPDRSFPGETAAIILAGDDRSVLYLPVFDLVEPSSQRFVLGTIEFTRQGDQPVAEGDFRLAFGDVMDSDGYIRSLNGVSYQNVTPVLRNYLGDNHPNPFNPMTTIDYSIRERGHVSLKIYDVAGRLVKTLVDEVQTPTGETRSAVWNGQNNQGGPAASGIYFYRLQTGSYVQTKKMVLLK